MNDSDGPAGGLKRIAMSPSNLDSERESEGVSSGQYYDVALSFAGEDREIAEEIAKLLREGCARVFYDKYEQADLWGKNLYDHLADIYSNRALYCIILVSGAYARKNWTTHERRSAQERALKERGEYILPVRLDDTEIPGLPSTTAYLDLRQVSIPDLVALALRKLGNYGIDEADRTILRALRESRYVLRSVTGLSKDTGLDDSAIKQRLISLIERGLAGQRMGKKGMRWYLTQRGIDALAWPPEAKE
jgi:hypothetical protein